MTALTKGKVISPLRVSAIKFTRVNGVRICANKIVAGFCSSTLLCNIRQVDARQFQSAAQDFNQLEGLAIARS